MNIKTQRTDFSHKKRTQDRDEIVIEKDPVAKFYHLITYSRYYDENDLANTISLELASFITTKKIKKPFHALVIGIGNDSHTADSVGPKVIKKLNVNAHLKNIGLPIVGNVISALEPGVLGETGIETRRIVEAVTEEVKPDLVILIDALVTDSTSDLAHSLVLSDAGLTPGSGLKGLNCEINESILAVPVLTIGVATAIEVRLPKEKDESLVYLLSPSDIDTYVDDISRTIAKGLNDCFKDAKC